MVRGSPPSNTKKNLSKRTINEEATIKMVQLERSSKGTMIFTEKITKSTVNTDNTGNDSKVSAAVARLEESYTVNSSDSKIEEVGNAKATLDGQGKEAHYEGSLSNKKESNTASTSMDSGRKESSPEKMQLAQTKTKESNEEKNDKIEGEAVDPGELGAAQDTEMLDVEEIRNNKGICSNFTNKDREGSGAAPPNEANAPTGLGEAVGTHETVGKAKQHNQLACATHITPPEGGGFNKAWGRKERPPQSTLAEV